ncbi:histidine kinase [Selenomonas ruminantium]|uniref:histidine kinase n=1 Tax=Selenomonas ruminantium TaxID=971 RepID=A0A1M6SVA9_SELRU|nr:HAMP domain-containing sensor histidine kinase [Selenomonas ruminantium]SHK48587.1 histidine kinase [Selenomonas ruminantium]
MKHTLLRKMLLYFSAIILLFSLIIGLAFACLFARHSQDVHQEEMQKRAIALAAAIPAMEEAAALLQAESIGPDTQPAQPGRGGPGMGHARHHGRMMQQGWCRRQYTLAPHEAGSNSEADQRLASFFRQLNELGEGEVWLVGAGSHIIRSYGAENEETITELPPAAEALITDVLSGQPARSQAFSPLLGVPAITAAAPIYHDGRISGAILLHHSLQNMETSIWQGLRLLALSLLLALLLTGTLAWGLARHFSSPLLKMQQTARAFASGDLTARTGIRQQDEIGQLAADLDALGTELLQARTERQELQKQRQEFLAAISHELRTPLTILRGTLELLWQDLSMTSEAKARCQSQASSSLKTLERLVGDLLELTRLQNPGFILQKAPLDITEAFRDAVRQMQVIARDKHITIQTDFSQPLPMDGDYGRLRQLLIILLDNAIKFSPEASAITVRQQVSETGWQISVIDQGCGIAPEELPHIFAKFHSTRSNNQQGTGLGLAIAQEIAQRHGLQLTCKSQPAQGSTFTIHGRKSSGLPAFSAMQNRDILV